MCRNIRRHTNSDTYRSVYKKVRESCRKHRRLLTAVIKVRYKINDILFDIYKQRIGKACHSRFCITVSSRAVTVDRAEVTLTLNENISHREGLGKSYHCVINCGITVRMVSTEHVTDCGSRLSERLIVCEMVLVHSI